MTILLPLCCSPAVLAELFFTAYSRDFQKRCSFEPKKYPCVSRKIVPNTWMKLLVSGIGEISRKTLRCLSLEHLWIMQTCGDLWCATVSKAVAGAYALWPPVHWSKTLENIVTSLVTTLGVKKQKKGKTSWERSEPVIIHSLSSSLSKQFASFALLWWCNFAPFKVAAAVYLQSQVNYGRLRAFGHALNLRDAFSPHWGESKASLYSVLNWLIIFCWFGALNGRIERWPLNRILPILYRSFVIAEFHDVCSFVMSPS